MNLDRSTCRELRDRIEKHLSSLNIEGIDIRLGNGSFSPNNATFKLEVSVKNEDGVVMSKDAENWDIYCWRLEP